MDRIKLNLATYEPIDFHIPESTPDGLDYEVSPRMFDYEPSEYETTIDELTDSDDDLPERQSESSDSRNIYSQINPQLAEALRIRPKQKAIESSGHATPDWLTSASQVSKWNNPVYSGESSWVAMMKQAYRNAGITNNDTLSMLVSQDAIESSWGKSAQGSFNYGNITTGRGYKGKYVVGRDKDKSGKPITQYFRAYDSVDEYVKDKVALLKRSYDFTGNETPDELISKLNGNNHKKYRYAESPEYSRLLKDVYQSYKRKKY